MRHILRILLTALPKVALSRAFGLFSRIPLPQLLRTPVYRTYTFLCGANLDEMEGVLADYPSLAAFFQRPLKIGRRPIDSTSEIVWPCDGKVLTAGPITGGRIEQIKGVTYGLDELLVDQALADIFTDGTQATIYLAPSDYHRVHAPFRAELIDRIHLPGTLFPTNPPAVNSIERLYPRNERVIHRFRLPDGRDAVLIMVGAFNVGDIQASCTAPCSVNLGDEVGRFGLGSTTILLLPRGTPAIANHAGQTRAQMGAAVPLTGALQ